MFVKNKTIFKQRLSQLFILSILIIVCGSCTREDKKKSAALQIQINATPISSPKFESIINQVDDLSATYAVPLLLEISNKVTNQHNEAILKEKALLQAYKIATKKQKKEILYRMICFYYEEMFCFIPTLESYSLSEGYKRCRELSNNYSLSREEEENLLNREAEYLKWMGQYKEALSIQFKLLERNKKQDDIQKVISSLREISSLYYQMGNIKESEKNNREAYKIALEKGLINRQIGLLSSLSYEAHLLGKYNESIRLSKMLLDIVPDGNVVNIYYRMADTYIALDSLDIARKYLFATFNLKIGDRKAETYRRLADSYIKENNKDSASHYIYKTQEEFFVNRKANIFKQKDNVLMPFSAFPSCVNFAKMLEEKGYIQESLQAMNLIKSMTYGTYANLNILEASKALNLFASLYRKTGQYENAFIAMERRDSLLNINNKIEQRNNYEEITNLFNNQQIINNIKREEQSEKNTQRTFVLILIIVLILLIALIVMNWMYSRSKEQIQMLNRKQSVKQSVENDISSLSKQQTTEILFKKLDLLVTQKELFKKSDLAIEQIAHEMRLNKAIISTTINNYAGKNYNQWINDHRMSYVLKHLTPNSDIKELYAEAGFPSTATFYRCFKQYTSMSPSQYIEQMLDTTQTDTLQQTTE